MMQSASSRGPNADAMDAESIPEEDIPPEVAAVAPVFRLPGEAASDRAKS
jgi:hypothetical protein